tara:strand:- start:2191 stop:3213 length:1023 start_codon:yes stop_codon:yes gene_type:complete
MNPILAFIKTTRPVNLLIIAATMFTLRHFVEGGFIRLASSPFKYPMAGFTIYQISEIHFSLLTLIMVFLAASGNIINDYFDVKVDRINKPNRITIDRGFKRRVAMAAHHTFNAIAVSAGIYLGWAEKVWFYAITPIFIAGALWFYSFYLKKTFLLGNVLVALIVSIVPLWATYGIINQPLIITADINGNSSLISDFYIFFTLIVLAYTIQAYMISLFREIVKDAEDVKGDKEFGYKTLPILWGWNKTRRVLLVSMTLWFLVLLATTHYITSEFIAIWGLLFGILVAVPFLLSIWSLRKSNIKKAHFTKASFLLKITLGGGLIFSAFIPELMDSFLYQYFN